MSDKYKQFEEFESRILEGHLSFWNLKRGKVRMTSRIQFAKEP